MSEVNWASELGIDLAKLEQERFGLFLPLDHADGT